MAIKWLVVTRFSLEPLDPLESLNRVLREVGVGRGHRRAGAIRVETRNTA
jgi:hypothetical protein